MKIHFDGLDDVLKNLRQASIDTMAEVFLQSQYTAAEMENYSKLNRPWTDRTGNARRSIYGVAIFNTDVIRIYHGIRVDYGKHLELSYGGKYRVIQPTIDTFRHIWFNRLEGAMRA